MQKGINKTMQLNKTTRLNSKALTGLAALGLVAAPPAPAQTPPSLTYHLDSGTSILNFDNTTKPGQWLRFEVVPQSGAGSATITASALSYTGSWVITTNDVLASTKSSNVTLIPNYLDLKSSTVTIPNSLAVSFFQLPVDTFGGQFSFDIAETGAASGAPTDFIVYANDDLVKIADLRFTPGSDRAVLVSSAPGVSILGTNGTPAPAAAPEPSQTAALGLGVVGLAGLALRAKKRRTA